MKHKKYRPGSLRPGPATATRPAPATPPPAEAPAPVRSLVGEMIAEADGIDQADRAAIPAGGPGSLWAEAEAAFPLIAGAGYGIAVWKGPRGWLAGLLDDELNLISGSTNWDYSKDPGTAIAVAGRRVKKMIADQQG